jgi:hypothetical protein
MENKTHWLKEEDEKIIENYHVYKTLNSVYEMLATILEDKKTPEQIACRLYQFQVIDKNTLTSAFPTAKIPRSVILQGNIVESSVIEDMRQTITKILVQKERKHNGLEWVVVLYLLMIPKAQRQITRCGGHQTSRNGFYYESLPKNRYLEPIFCSFST